MWGELGLAASVGVVAALLLGVKPGLHRLLLKIDYEELLAILKLLAMSVVLLPVLPNRGYGPWQMLNPYEVWLMVVLICSISFVGYLGIRILGERRGVTLAALAGGLISSTAVAISLSRMAQQNGAHGHVLAGGNGRILEDRPAPQRPVDPWRERAVDARQTFADAPQVPLLVARLALAPPSTPAQVGGPSGEGLDAFGQHALDFGAGGRLLDGVHVFPSMHRSWPVPR